MAYLASASWQPYTLPLRSPLRTAHHLWQQRCGAVILVRDTDGVVGYGESAPFGGTESWDGMAAQLAMVLPQWVGRPLPTLEELATWLEPCDSTPASRHGLEQALLNLLAQRAGVPLAMLLAAPEDTPSSLVPVNRLVGSGNVQETLGQVQRGFDEGDRCFKLKVGQDFATDWQRVQRVRSWLGNRGELRLDANGSWSLEAAIAHCATLSPWGIEYIEQPVATAADMAELRQRAVVPVAADELVASPAVLWELLDRGVADVYVLKPMQLGGLLRAKAAARAILREGLAVVVTTALDGAIARHGAMHLAATLPKTYAHGLGTGSLLAEDLAYDCPAVHRGYVEVYPTRQN